MPLRDQIRHQNAEEMVAGQNIAGKNDGKKGRRAVADHLRALKAGVKEVLKAACAEEEAKDWGPKERSTTAPERHGHHHGDSSC